MINRIVIIFYVLIHFLLVSCTTEKNDENVIVLSLNSTIGRLKTENDKNIHYGKVGDKSMFSLKTIQSFLANLDELEKIRKDFYKDRNEVGVNHQELYYLIVKYSNILDDLEKKYEYDNLIGPNFLLSNSESKKNSIDTIDPYVLKSLITLEMEVVFSIYFDLISSRI